MSEDTLRRAVAELVGTFTLTFIGAGAAVAASIVHDPSLIGVAIAHGLAIGVMVSRARATSPAGTSTRRSRSVSSITSRIKPALARHLLGRTAGGAALAALLVQELLPRATTEAVNLGVPALGNGVDATSGFRARGDPDVLLGARRVRQRPSITRGPFNVGRGTGDRADDLDRRALRRAVHRRRDEPVARVRAAARWRPLGQRLGLVRRAVLGATVAALLYELLYLRPAKKLEDVEPAKSGVLEPRASELAAERTMSERAPGTGRGVYLARHGQTAYNLEGRFQGQLPVPLDETGRAQAGELAERAAAHGFAALWCSTLLRARETAEIVSARIGLELKEDARLDGDERGRLDGPVVQRGAGAKPPSCSPSSSAGDPTFAFPGRGVVRPAGGARGRGAGRHRSRCPAGAGGLPRHGHPRRPVGRAPDTGCRMASGCRTARSSRSTRLRPN